MTAPIPYPYRLAALPDGDPAGHATRLLLESVPGNLFAQRMSDSSAPPIARRLRRAGQRSQAVSSEAVKGPRTLHEAREGSDVPAAHGSDASGNPTNQGAPGKRLEAPHRISEFCRGGVPTLASARDCRGKRPAPGPRQIILDARGAA